MDEALTVTLLVIRALERFGIQYFIGGSIASSLHGIPRSTHDSDLVADVRAEQAADLTRELEGDFYVDTEMIRSAVAQRRSFNVIHLRTMFKVDVFVLKRDREHRQELARRCAVELPNRETIYVSSAEDIILEKLAWYRLGERVSERQMQDVVGVLLVQGDSLDDGYLEREAEARDLAELLAEARARRA